MWNLTLTNISIRNISLLTFAAIDTSSTLLFSIFQLLAQHPDVQSRLRQEILENRNGEDLPYDRLMHMPYLHGVFCETLRLYVSNSPLDRSITDKVIIDILGRRTSSESTSIPYAVCINV